MYWSGTVRPRASAVLLAATAVVVLVASVPAFGLAPIESTEQTDDGRPFVTVRTPTAAVARTDDFELTADIVIDRPTSYLESRLQIRNPSGRLLYQKTEVRNEVPTGTVSISYQRELEDLDLPPAVYPMELRVRSDAEGLVREWVVDSDLLVYDSDAESVPITLVVRVAAVPSFDPEGRFILDPGANDTAREQVDALARLVLGDDDIRLSLALPPLVAEEWARIASGYEVNAPGGVEAVPADEETPQAYAETLEVLSAALDTGRLELLSLPYADPDIIGLQSIDRVGDLAAHFERGLSANLAALETSGGAGTLLAEGMLPRSSVVGLVARKIEYAIVSSATVEPTATVAGVYGLDAEDARDLERLLVIDDAASDAFRPDSETRLLDLAFERLIALEDAGPLVALAEVGPGREVDIEDIEACLADVKSQPWIELATAQTAARHDPSGELGLKDEPLDGVAAPGGYWAEVDAARSLSHAFLQAAGINDPEAQAANDASLIAESRAWAGPDEIWASADRGLGFAAAAERVANATLGGVSLSAQDITLSSSQGEVPLILTNASEKNLLVTINVRARNIALGDGDSFTVTARPQDNFVTVPVDLQSSLSGTLVLSVSAGDEVLDQTQVTVRATFLDRLVVVGGVSIVLVGLLLFIRHRARTAASAGTMSEEPTKDFRA